MSRLLLLRKIDGVAAQSSLPLNHQPGWLLIPEHAGCCPTPITLRSIGCLQWLGLRCNQHSACPQPNLTGVGRRAD